MTLRRLSTELTAIVRDLLGSAPGQTGTWLRRAYHSKRFLTSGRKICIGRHNEISGEQQIAVGDGFYLVGRSYLCAHDSSRIEIGD